MNNLLQSFAALPETLIWLIFLSENLLLTGLILLLGRIIQRCYDPATVTPYVDSRREWFICIITNILNTIITYIGYWFWKKGFIVTGTTITWRIIVDFLLLFLAMDLLMYLFHFLIHKTVLYKLIHQLHHEAVHPKPIDLFILHPIETLSFGALWLILLLCYAFNIWSIIIYLIVNLVFGLAGHLGIEPLPVAIRRIPVFNVLGTSTFHHDHHEDVACNFGFYTNLWDKLFGTWKRS